jgi:hypothetical protein
MTTMMQHETTHATGLRVRPARLRQHAPAKSTGLREDRASDQFVSETRVVRIEATLAAVVDALDRLQVGDRLLGAVQALGLGERVTAAPDPPREARTTRGAPGAVTPQRAVTVSWRLGEGSVVTARLELLAEADGDEAVLVSAMTRFLTNGTVARERLHAAWGIVGPLAHELPRRWLTAIARLAEEAEEPT